jgi:hypothetical protein
MIRIIKVRCCSTAAVSYVTRCKTIITNIFVIFKFIYFEKKNVYTNSRPECQAQSYLTVAGHFSSFLALSTNDWILWQKLGDSPVP